MPSLRDNVLRTRWLQLADELKEMSLDSLLLTDPADVRWLTGYSGSNGAALAVTDGPPLLATDGRYTEQSGRECPEAEIIITRDLVEQLLLRLREHSVSELGVDPGSLTLSQFRLISAHPALFGVAVQEIASPLAKLRTVKDLHELESVAAACRISVEALGRVLEQVKVGMTELHLARTLEMAMGDLGAEDRSFETIVAAGENGGRPHHTPTDRPLAAGDLVTIDFGAMIDGYHADCTRTVIVAAEPEEWQEKVHAAVKHAASAGRKAAGPGVPTAVVDAAARAVIEEAGYGEYFPHGVGHGVGLDIHEAPQIASAATDTLALAVPFTVEPGIYIPGQGGVRIEDTCVLRADGLEVLTDFPRKLLRVG